LFEPGIYTIVYILVMGLNTIESETVLQTLEKNKGFDVLSCTSNSILIGKGRNKKLMVSPVPMLYHTTTGWKDIDPTIQGSDREGYAYMVKTNLFHTYIDTSAPKVRVEYRGDWIEMNPSKIRWVNSQGAIAGVVMAKPGQVSVSGNRVLWKDIFGGGIDLEYIISGQGVFKNVIFNSLSSIKIPNKGFIKAGGVYLEVVMNYESNRIMPLPEQPSSDQEAQEDRIFNCDIESFLRLGDSCELAFRPPRFFDQSENNLVYEYHKMFPEVIPRTYGIEGGKPFVTTRMELEWIKEAIYPVYCDADLTVNVSSGTDDCYETKSSGGDNYNLTGSDLYLGSEEDSYEVQFDNNIGLRFQNITIPQSATIDSAKVYLYFVGKWGADADTVLTAYGDKVDNSATFSSGSLPSARTKTSASVDATLNLWGSTSTSQYNATPELKTIVQEIVNRSGWSSGNALSILIFTGADPTNYLRLRSYDAGSSPPYIEIDYTTPESKNKTLTGRILIPQSKNKDLTGRVIISTSKDKDLEGRILISQSKDKNITGRLIISSSKDKDITGRLTIQESKEKGLSGRLIIGTAKEKSIAGRIEIANSKNKDFTSRMMVPSSKDKSLEGRILVAYTKDKAITSRIAVSTSSNKAINSLIKVLVSKAKSIDSRILLGYSAGKTIDAEIALAPEKHKHLNSRIEIGYSETKDIQARVLIEGSKDKYQNSRILVSQTKGKEVNSRILIGDYKEKNLESRVSIPHSKEKSLDSRVLVPHSRDKDIVARIRLTESSNKEVSSRILIPSTKNKSLQSRIIHSKSVDKYLDSRIKILGSKDKDLSAGVTIPKTKEKSILACIQTSVSKQKSINSYIKTEDTFLKSINSAVLVGLSRDKTIDSRIGFWHDSQKDLTARVSVSQSKSKTMDSWIILPITKIRICQSAYRLSVDQATYKVSCSQQPLLQRQKCPSHE